MFIPLSQMEIGYEKRSEHTNVYMWNYLLLLPEPYNDKVKDENIESSVNTQQQYETSNHIVIDIPRYYCLIERDWLFEI